MAQKHAQHGQQGSLGAGPRRDSNGAAPLVIKSTRQRRLAHHEQHAVMHGAHLVLEAIRHVPYLLRTRVWYNALCQYKNNCEQTNEGESKTN